MRKALTLVRTVSLLILALASFNVLQAQDRLYGTWYFKSPDGQMNARLVISEQELLYERYESYNVDTPYWKEDKKLAITFQESNDESHTFSGGENGKLYAGEIFVDPGRNTIYLYEMRDASGSSQQALQKLSDKTLKKELSKVAYSKERLAEIESYPSLDELNKAQLIEVMDHLFGYENAMKAFDDRMISRIGRNVMNRKLISMNFDPDKPTNGYFMKRFAEDPDIKLLLDKQVYFKMY